MSIESRRSADIMYEGNHITPIIEGRINIIYCLLLEGGKSDDFFKFI
jgi:hypothetical protein